MFLLKPNSGYSTKQSPVVSVINIKNDKDLQQQLFTHVSKDYQFNNSLYVYTTWVGICGNDERLDNNSGQSDEPYYRFDLEKKTYSFDNKSVIVTSIELSDKEEFVKKHPTSLKINYQFDSAKNVAFTLTDNKHISRVYRFKQLKDDWLLVDTE